MCALKINIQKILESPENFSTCEESEDYPELIEIGCFGSISVNLSLITTGRNFWINGHASGLLHYECKDCGSPLDGTFRIPVKLLIENNAKGVNSRYYVPGPFSSMEDFTWNFLAWYMQAIKP